MKRKKIFLCAGAMMSLLVLLFQWWLPSPALAVVRVGYIDLPSNIEIEKNGYCSGYAYEYLQALAATANWEFAYMPGTGGQLIKSLRQGELDLLVGVPEIPELQAEFNFSWLPMGSSSLVFSLSPQSPRVQVAGYRGFDGIKIGLLPDFYAEEQLAAFSRQHGFSCQVQYFATVEELSQAIQSGSVDGIVADRNQYPPIGPVLEAFEPRLLYTVVKKQDVGRLEQLNRAAGEIQLNDPQLLNRLYQKYYTAKPSLPLMLTADEKQYLQQRGELVVVASADQKPYSYFEGGQLKGIVGDIAAKLSSDLGISVRAVETKTYAEALQAIHDNSADIILNFFGDYSWAEKNQVRITQPYIQSQYVALTRQGQQGDVSRVAGVKDYFYTHVYLENKFPAGSLQYYDTIEGCLDAVADGRADMTLINAFLASTILSRGKYHDLQVNYNQVFPHQSSMAVNMQQDPRLLRILNKEINHLSEAEISYITNTNTVVSDTNDSIEDFIYRYPLAIIGSLLGTVLLAALLFIWWNEMRKLHLQRIYDLAYKDPATGLYNPRWLAEFVSVDEDDKNLAVVFMNVRHLDLIAEQYGQSFSCELIKAIATRLKAGEIAEKLAIESTSGSFIYLCRFQTIAALKSAIQEFLINDGVFVRDDIHIKAQLLAGIYLYDDPGVKMAEAINFARIACWRVHNTAGIRLQFFNERLQQTLRLEQAIEFHMEKALQKKEFKVYYQAKVEMKSQQICGAEALVRWDMPGRGFLNPGQFIPLFEKNGFVVRLDFYMLEAVCDFQRARLNAGKKLVTISVNQSRLHLSDPEYIEKLRAVAQQYDLPPGTVELEITETAFADISDNERRQTIRDTLATVRSLGFLTSVDDFGSGYSSLMLLNDVPWDTLKLDRSFLEPSANTERTRIILQKIIIMAKELGIQVISEGVETEEQAMMLQSLGCTLAQGYLYAKPAPPAALEQILDEGGDMA